MRSRIWRAAGLAAAMAALVTGCAKPPPPPPPPPLPVPAAPKQDAPRSETRYLYVPEVRDGEIAYVATPVSRDKASSPRTTMQALMDVTRDGERLFPKGVKVLGFTTDSTGKATVNLSSEISAFSGGSMEEVAAVNAMVLTASQFPKVRSVEFLSEGEEIESLAGHLDLTVPQNADWSLVSANFRPK